MRDRPDREASRWRAAKKSICGSVWQWTYGFFLQSCEISISAHHTLRPHSLRHSDQGIHGPILYVWAPFKLNYACCGTPHWHPFKVCPQFFEIQRRPHKVKGAEVEHCLAFFKTHIITYQNELGSERIAAQRPQQVHSSQPRHVCFRNDYRRLEDGNSFQRFDCVAGPLYVVTPQSQQLS